MNKNLTILLIDDSPADRELYRRFLQKDKLYSYKIYESDSAEDAIALSESVKPDLILLDFLLPDTDGLELLKQFQQQFASPHIPLIMITGHGDETIAVEAMKQGAQDYLIKDKLNFDLFCRTVHTVYNKVSLLKKLELQKQQQRLIAEMSLRIRQSLKLEDILNKTVEEVREFIKADRVVVYKFEPDMSGIIVAESVLPEWTACLNLKIEDTCFKENLAIDYRQGKKLLLSNIYESNLTDCHLQLLEEFQVKSNLVVPILLNNQNLISIWGLLVVHQCSYFREWQSSEVSLLEQLAVQIAIAIQQAELYKNLQNFNAELETKVQLRTAELRESERKFKAIFDKTFEFIGLLNSEGIILEINQGLLDFLGLKIADVVGKPFWSLLTDNKAIEQYHKIASTGEFVRYELSYTDVAGNIHNFDCSLKPVKNDTGKVILIIAEARDITEFKKIQAEKETLLKKEQKARTEAETRRKQIQNILASLTDPIQGNKTGFMAFDRNWCFTYINEEAAKNLRRQSEELIGKNLWAEFPGLKSTSFGQLFKQSLATMQLLEIEDYSTVFLGWFSLRACPSSIGLSVYFRNITELREAQLQRDRFFNNCLEIMVIMDTQGRLLQINPAWEQITGFNYVESKGKNFRDYVHPEDLCLLSNNIEILEQINACEFRFLCSDKQYCWLSWNAIFIKEEQLIYGFARDISERKRAEKALQQLNQNLELHIREQTAELARRKQEIQALVDHAPDVIFRVDSQLRYLYCNQAGEKLMGTAANDLIGKTAQEVGIGFDIITQWQNLIELINSTGKEATIEQPFPTSDSETWLQARVVPEFDEDGNIVSFLGIARDVTDRIRIERDRLVVEEKLRRAEQQYRTLVESIPAVIYVSPLNKRLADRYISPQIEELLHITPQEWKAGFDEQDWITHVHPDDLLSVAKTLELAVTKQQSFCAEYRMITTDGEEVWVRDQAMLVKDELGNPIALQGVATNITERKKTELEFIKNRNLREAIFNESADALFLIDAASLLIIDCNRRAVELFETRSKNELIGINEYYGFSQDELTAIVSEMEEGTLWKKEIEYVTFKGNHFWGNLAVRLIDVADEKLYLVRITDISDLKEAERKLRASLQEKEVILREIHHRVKNNLYIVSSLLKLQSSSIKDVSVLASFQESQNRIQSMALIHEKLYQSEDLARINFADYVQNLLKDIFRSYGVNSRLIALEININNVFLNIDTAIPCGLIINELVSNSLKYAFPLKRKGLIIIKLEKNINQQLILTIADDGIGIPLDLDLKNLKSLGLRLVYNLTEQLDGNIVLERDSGTKFIIIFMERCR